MAMLHRGAQRAGRDARSRWRSVTSTAYLGPDRAACLHEAKALARYASLLLLTATCLRGALQDEVDAIRAR
jgi:hypothetical protein